VEADVARCEVVEGRRRASEHEKSLGAYGLGPSVGCQDDGLLGRHVWRSLARAIGHGQLGCVSDV
jgi:hypothetical protein